MQKHRPETRHHSLYVRSDLLDTEDTEMEKAPMPLLEHDETLERLQRKLDTLTKRAQQVRAKGARFRHISSLLDETVAALREALAREYPGGSGANSKAGQDLLH